MRPFVSMESFHLSFSIFVDYSSRNENVRCRIFQIKIFREERVQHWLNFIYERANFQRAFDSNDLFPFAYWFVRDYKVSIIRGMEEISV